jgi:hypothetical protein
MVCIRSSIRPVRDPLIWATVILFFAVHPIESPGAEPFNADDVRAVLESSPRASYRIFAVRVGTAPDARRGLFIADPSMPKRIEVAFAFWVLKSKERIALREWSKSALKRFIEMLFTAC